MSQPSGLPYIPSPSPTPTRNVHSTPRPPHSPLRPASPSSLPPVPRRTSSLTSPALNVSSSMLKSPSTPPPGNKTRARDLLRKHYGLGVGPPPILRADGGGKVNDPMDLGRRSFVLVIIEVERLIILNRFPGIRCKDILRTTHHNIFLTNIAETGERIINW